MFALFRLSKVRARSGPEPLLASWSMRSNKIVYSMDGFSGDASPVFPLPNWATWHKPTAVASARRLLELRPQRIAVGHGKPVLENAVPALELAIRHAE